MNENYRLFTRKIRSEELTRRLQERLDLHVRSLVASLGSRFVFDQPIEHYLISRRAWDHVYGLRLNPVSVFCHPNMLVEEPFVSLYYRGLCGLSQVEVANQVCSVQTWERDPHTRHRKARVDPGRALAVACLYNGIMCSVIENTRQWVLENGYRNLIASLGITFDGSIRNTFGDIAEQRVRKMLLNYLVENQLLIEPAYVNVDDIPDQLGRGTFRLNGGVQMIFAAEPDVSFRRDRPDRELMATLEIKGGIDPKGALERLGAAEKSARAAIAERPHCENFLIAGVITEEMGRRLEQSNLFKERFLLIELLSDEDQQALMFDEIFNHSLRIVGA